MMREAHAIRLQADDGYETFAREWRPEPSIGSVLYLHGIQSHGQWFEESAQCLAEAGFHVLLPDRRGSGRNDRQRGHVRSAGRLIADVAHALETLRPPDNSGRVHLLGVSWGGKLALAAAARMPERIASLTLVAPGLFPSVDLPLIRKVLVACSALAWPRKQFEIPLNEPERFTTNAARMRFIAADSHRLLRVSAAFLTVSAVLDWKVRRAAAMELPFPVHFVLAGHDRIIDNDRTRAFARNLRTPALCITEFPDADHTLEFEANAQPYRTAVVNWLEVMQAGTNREEIGHR